MGDLWDRRGDDREKIEENSGEISGKLWRNFGKIMEKEMIWEDEEYAVSLRRNFGSACQGAGVKDFVSGTNEPTNEQSKKTINSQSGQ